jgi:hypothetical protein
MKNSITKLGLAISLCLMLVAFAANAHAAVLVAPEMDSSSIGAALALVVGSYLVVVSKFRQK